MCVYLRIVFLLSAGLCFFNGLIYGSCAAPKNPIEAENCLPGSPPSEWFQAGDTTIQGFPTNMSVNLGQAIDFKVLTNATSYRIDIYRMGYYGGNGARKVATVTPSALLPQTQPACLTQGTLIDCGNWTKSASWTVPSNATSGFYIGRLVRLDTLAASHMFFVVRNDSSRSDLLFQTSDMTWQAYNLYGGNSLYGPNFSLPARAFKVSYNRPIINTNPNTMPLREEYPMVRWLEANGYDVSYIAGVDSERNGSVILRHDVFLSVGHDEYWSGVQRTNVENALKAGVSLAFFSGNELFWKTRWESSIDGSGTTYRTLVCYKETHANTVIDPADPPTWTGTWRDPRFSPPADGGRPENALTGTSFRVGSDPTGRNDPITIPQADGRMRFWRNTSVATLGSGQSYTTAPGYLGYEWDIDEDNGFRPAGLIPLSTTTQNVGAYLNDYGSTYVPRTATHRATMYRAPSGALVFSAGTVQWSWALDSNHEGPAVPMDKNLQQATVNLLADMGDQPATLMAGLVAATASTDTVAPTSTITSPVNGTNLPAQTLFTVTGTAADQGGGVVGAVEVSLDGGATWHPAVGRENWSYQTAVNVLGNTNIRSRAVDDSGNIENPKGGIMATTNCPCSTQSEVLVPSQIDTFETSPLELGVKFRADSNGVVTGIRFYKAPGNTGTHTGSLWTSTGTRLATATFTNETASGWQQVNFSTPVAITANTVYVASYFAPVGHYSVDRAFFTAKGVNNPPLHLLQDGVSGGNGVFHYTTPGFPQDSYQGSNYWVDVVFVPQTYTVYSPSTVPSIVDAGLAAELSLGVRFRADRNGFITGVRFYKSAANTGRHVGSLWTNSGNLLATAVFTNETASGWQQANFTTPVAISANSVYVASYYDPNGHFSLDLSYFDDHSVDAPPLHLLADGASGANGLYIYNAGNVFPLFSFLSSTYWVDVVFQ